MEEGANIQAQEHANAKQAAHEVAMAAHLANKARKQALATGATEVKVEAAAQSAVAIVNVARSRSTSMT